MNRSDNEPRELQGLLAKLSDGDLTTSDVDRLNELLRGDPEACEVYINHLTLEAGLYREFCAGAPGSALIEPLAHGMPSGRRVTPMFQGWLRYAAVLVAGMMVGLLGATVAWAGVAPWLDAGERSVKRVFDETFESGFEATSPGLPLVVGGWTGDETEVSGPVGEVAPLRGSRMLRFRNASYPGEGSQRSRWCDIYRMVDLGADPWSEGATARLAANFAALPGGPGDRYLCSVELLGLDALPDPGVMKQGLAALRQITSASGSRRVHLRGDGRWQEVSAGIPIPPGTRYFVLHLAVEKDDPNFARGIVEFPAHFLDEVTLEVVSPR